MIRPKQIYLLCLLGLLLMGCNTGALREAQRTLAMADSLRAEGTACTDSVRLAEAVGALQPYRLLRPTAWAKANYYYGMLLYDSGNYVASMASFIRASHARTRDKVLLGRVYANLAYICREQGEHAMAYEVYTTSATMFLQGGDSILYYYGQNNMAFELAAQQDSSVFALLDSINAHCSNKGVRMKSLEIKATAFEYFGLYDSVLVCTQQLLNAGYADATGYMSRTRAFFYLEQPDSALFYAQKVMECSLSASTRYDALYILTNCDATLNTDSLLSLVADRADYGTAKEKEQANLAQAVQLLQQDKARKPNRSWIYVALSAVLSLVLLVLLVFLIRRNRKQQLLQKKAQHELMRHQQQIVQLQQIEQQHHDELQRLQAESINAQIELEHICEALSGLTDEELKRELCWNDYERMCSIVNSRMFLLVDKLKQKQCLKEKEIRLCILVLIDGTYERMTSLLPYSKNGIGKYKQTVAQKLHTTTTDFRQYLVKLCIERLNIAQ